MMDVPDNAQIHGDAWKYFRQDTQPEHRTLELWCAFLRGWLAKAKQRDDLRNRR